jgi:hypothetical protein
MRIHSDKPFLAALRGSGIACGLARSCSALTVVNSVFRYFLTLWPIGALAYTRAIVRLIKIPEVAPPLQRK